MQALPIRKGGSHPAFPQGHIRWFLPRGSAAVEEGNEVGASCLMMYRLTPLASLADDATFALHVPQRTSWPKAASFARKEQTSWKKPLTRVNGFFWWGRVDSPACGRAGSRLWGATGAPFTPAPFESTLSSVNDKTPSQRTRSYHWWGRVDSNHRRHSQQIYSLSPLATREHPRIHLRPKEGLELVDGLEPPTC